MYFRVLVGLPCSSQLAEKKEKKSTSETVLGKQKAYGAKAEVCKNYLN